MYFWTTISQEGTLMNFLPQLFFYAQGQRSSPRSSNFASWSTAPARAGENIQVYTLLSILMHISFYFKLKRASNREDVPSAADITSIDAAEETLTAQNGVNIGFYYPEYFPGQIYLPSYVDDGVINSACAFCQRHTGRQTLIICIKTKWVWRALFITMAERGLPEVKSFSCNRLVAMNFNKMPQV